MLGSCKNFSKGRANRNPKGKKRCWCEECTGNYDAPFTRTQEKRELKKEIEDQLNDDE